MSATLLLKRLVSLTGWKAVIVYLLMGACAMATLAPLFLTPLLIPVFCLLFHYTHHSKNWKNTFFIHWCFGLGFFLTGTYWIALSLLVDSTNFGWMIPFATLGLSSILAVFYGLSGLSYHVITTRFKISSTSSHIILFSVLFAIAELLRSYSFTGFPWNAIGYSMAVHEALLQPASLVGIYGVNLLTVLFATLPVILFYKVERAKRVFFISIILFSIIVTWGIMRVSDNSQTSNTITARIVQGNVEKHRKWDKEKAYREYASMTKADSLTPLDLIIWPESSFPYFIDPSSDWPKKLASLLNPESTLLTGALRWQETKDKQYKIWNSLAAISAKGVPQYYDKHHLVPFGEYVPFRNILPIKKIIPGKIDFTPSLEKKALSLTNDITIGSLICYEAIFSRHAFFDKPIDLLVSITNDGWFAKSAGPYQHLHMARVRAVEQAVPLIRAANSGISAVYNSKGVLLDSIDLKVKAYSDVTIPLGADKGSLYSRYGLGSFFAFVFLLLSISLLLRHDDKH